MKQVSQTLVFLPPREILVNRAVSRMLFKAPHLTNQPNDISIKKDVEDAMRKVLAAVLDVAPSDPSKHTPLPELIAHRDDTLALIKELEDRLPFLSGLIEQAKAREVPVNAPVAEPTAASDEIAAPPADAPSDADKGAEAQP